MRPRRPTFRFCPAANEIKGCCKACYRKHMTKTQKERRIFMKREVVVEPFTRKETPTLRDLFGTHGPVRSAVD